MIPVDSIRSRHDTPAGRVVIYGANGYTGRLIARQAVSRELFPVLAGRNRETISQMAGEYGLAWRQADLDRPGTLLQTLDGVGVVIHCAGPFSHTARPMVRACLEAGVHYLDITGEYAVFEDLARLDGAAKACGIMVMPGAGFDVVPSDCLAAHLASRLPGAMDLKLAFAGLGGGMSRGTAKTMIEGLGYGGAIRRNHRIQRVPAGHKTRVIDFGGRSLTTVAIPWGDISTAWHSTGIPNVEVYMAVTPAMLRFMTISNTMGGLFRTGLVRCLLKALVDRLPARPRPAGSRPAHFSGARRPMRRALSGSAVLKPPRATP